MKNLISIIVPIYKVEAFVNRCIDSILKQTYTNLEIILVDDGSPDRCGEICDEYAKIDNRIRVLHVKNGGQSSARNAGLKIATGEYIGFVDGDDYIDINMYEILTNMAILNNSKITSIEYRIVDELNIRNNCQETETETETGDLPFNFIKSAAYIEGLLLHKADTSFCTKIFKREFIRNYDFPVGKLNEDFILLFNMLKDVDGILSVHKKKYNYVKRKGSTTNSGYSKTITDMVENANEAYQYSIRNYPNLNDIATRFYMYQIMTYLILIPIEDMNSSNELYLKSIKDIRKLKTAIISNEYLTFKNKLILIANCIAPRLFKKVVSDINYKKMYR